MQEITLVIPMIASNPRRKQESARRYADRTENWNEDFVG